MDGRAEIAPHLNGALEKGSAQEVGLIRPVAVNSSQPAAPANGMDVTVERKLMCAFRWVAL
jgi:hypothetical protein